MVYNDQTMSWFFIALIGPVLWAFVNHIDKYLLSSKFKGCNVGALMIFSTLLYVFILPLLYLANHNIFNLSLQNIILLITIGVLSGLAILPYMYALDEEETSIVIPLFQLVPIWGYFFSYVLLGETLSGLQIIGCLLIIIGSFIITLEIDEENKIKFKKRTIWLMLISTVLFALYEALFKFIAIDTGFVIASFWEYIGLLILGIFFLVFFKKYRESFIHLFKTQGKSIISLNFGSEFITIIGNMATNFALLLAPAALVLTVNGFQPLFVFIIGVFITFFLPKIYTEKLSKKHLTQKIISILIIVIGAVLISQ